MKTQEAIKTRRSIRRYTGEALTDQQLHMLLEAGFYAPTARNLQPTSFVVIQDKALLEQIAVEQPNAKYCVEAGCGILICGDRNVDEDGYLAENAAAAIQNMMLAAHAIGLGTVWCGVYPREPRVESFRKICKLPAHILPVGFMIVGHSAEEKEVPERFRTELVYTNQWQE